MNTGHKQAWEMLCGMDNILLLTHRSPDGDAIGSIFALALALKKAGKNVMCKTDRIPSSLSVAAVSDMEGDFEPSYIVTVDVADKKLLGEELCALYGDKVDLCIDHHGTNVEFAKHTLLDASAAAACEVLYDMFVAGGVEITSDIAKELYVGLATDTGCFRYGNTTSKTMRTAAELMDKGVDTVFINTEIFETKTREYADFERLALNNMTNYFDGRCAIMLITRDMYAKSGLDEADDKAINGVPRQIQGVLVGLTMKEKPDNKGWRISMRSKDPVSASEICAMLGGGGHKLAAGCELDCSKEEALEKILGAVKTVLDKADNK